MTSVRGHLALAMFRLRRNKRIFADVGRAPWLDITMTDPTLPACDRRDPYLSVPGLREAGRMYAGSLDPRDPRVSPIYGDLAALGRLAVYIGTRDTLLADSRRLRRLAEDNGIPLRYREEPNMFHGCAR